MKKIAILTQPLYDNYGGLLQAYALKETLKGIGYRPIIINRQEGKPHPARRVLSKLKSLALKRPVKTSARQILTNYQKSIISEKTIKFRSHYISELSDLIDSQKAMKSVKSKDFHAYVVGSDQCWRPRYSPYITNYFLDFVKDSEGIKKISYAASFGVDNWEFSRRQTKKCRELIKLFDAVSVREDDGVELVRKYLGRNDAIHLLDPTMLLGVESYRQLSEKERAKESGGNLKVYVLDKSSEKELFVNMIAENLELKPFEVMPGRRLGQEEVNDANAESFKYPCPTQWLKGFQDAEFIITDSFHGTVFSILHNKPFIALGNERRGMSRFTSLLNSFGLQDRLVLDADVDSARKLLVQDIDWTRVNFILGTERAKAFRFLKDSLES